MAFSKFLKGDSQEITVFRGTDNLTSEVTYKVDSNGSEMISDSNVSTEKRTKVIYEDLP